MPRLVEGSRIAGVFRPQCARRWGMAKAPAVAGGGGDNAASACGAGVVRPGNALLSLGTSGVLFVSTARFSPNPEGGVHAFCHAVPETWHQMGVILSAAGSLDWLARVLGTTAPNLLKLMAKGLKGPSTVIFLPYLSGERTPHNDAEIRGSFSGLAADTERKDLVHSVLDGVAFGFRDCLESLKSAKTDVSRGTAVGGGARSQAWLRIIATALGIPIDVPAAGGDVGAAFGAARLGLVAATGADPLEVCAPPRMVGTVEPDRRLAAAYEEQWLRYRALYPALMGLSR